MQNRYIVKEVVRDMIEPLDPGRQVWYIYDRKLEKLGLSYYIKEEIAYSICKDKNIKRNKFV